MPDTADIVLFTVNEYETSETQAVFDASLPAVLRVPYRYWDYGEIGGARVVHMVCNMADLAAGKSARAAMAAWQPSLLIALGIAWGAPDKDHVIGDVLLAAPLSDAAYAKISDKHGMQPRGDMWPQTDSLLQLVKSCHSDWQKKSPDERRKLHVGKVLSLPTLLDKKSLRDELLAAHPGAIGGEMEGRGVVDAAVEAKCDWLVLKAICDWGAEKNLIEGQKEIDQPRAARQAATFLRFAIDEGLGALAVQRRKTSSLSHTATTGNISVKRYHDAIAAECSSHTIARVQATDGDQPDQPRTEQVYVPPDVWVKERSDPKTAAKSKREGMELSVPKRQPLDSCLKSDDTQFQRIVLTAMSGMGKSTAVNVLVLALAKLDAQPWMALRLPSLLPLAIAPDDSVVAALRRDIVTKLKCGEAEAVQIGEEVVRALDAAPGVILFDALDEVVKSERPKVLTALRKFIAERKAAQPVQRIVLTSRPHAYEGELERDGFTQLSLALFTPAQVNALIEQYFSRVIDLPDVGAAMKRQVASARAAQSQADYVKLLEEPMLATFACMLASERARATAGEAKTAAPPLPDTRFALFDGVVRLVLEKWEAGRADAETKPLQRLFDRAKGRSILRTILERAAYSQLATLTSHPVDGDNARPPLVQDQLVTIADYLMPDDFPVRAKEVVRWLAERTVFLPKLDDGPPKRYQIHLQFSNFLAAAELDALYADKCDFAEALVERLLAVPDSMRQFVMMGLARLIGQPRALIASVVRVLARTQATLPSAEIPRQAWETLANFAIAWVDAVPPETWRSAADRTLNQALEPLRDRVLHLITTQQLSGSLRGEAADSLGKLGDQRFDEATPHLWARRFHTNSADEPLPGFVRIPAGEFKMGHEDESDNKPSRDVQIEHDFYIARTHTTVAQYACFVDAGGYELGAEVWGAQGVAWRQGEFDSQIENEDYKKWLARRAGALRVQPWDWTSQLAHPSRPVTGVSWFEARAYARWLDMQFTAAQRSLLGSERWEVRLPTEAQWERAARASSLKASHTQRWPWSDDETVATKCANVRGSGIDHVSSVGVFAPNAVGLYDMAGNAWQWMDNLYKSSSDVSFPSVERHYQLRTHKDLNKCDLLTLRGGSWIDNPEGASCSYRGMTLPVRSDDDFGLRVVLSLAEKRSVKPEP